MKPNFFSTTQGKFVAFLGGGLILLGIAIYIISKMSPPSIIDATGKPDIGFRSGFTTERQITIHWIIQENALEYELFRSIGNGEQVRIYKGPGNTHSDVCQFPEKPYTYYLYVNYIDKPREEFGPFYLPPFDPVTQNPINRQAPVIAPPIAGHDGVSFQMQRPGSDIDSILVERRGPGENAFTRLKMIPGTKLSFSDSSVAEKSPYAYRIRTLYQGRLSDPAELSVTTPKDPYKIVRPSTPVVSQTGAGADFLAFAVALADDKAESVLVERKGPGDRQFKKLRTLSPAESGFRDTGLRPGSPYQYRFKTVYEGEESDPAVVIAQTEQPPPPPEPPKPGPQIAAALPPLAEVSGSTDGSVSFSWTYQNASVEKVLIERRDNPEGEFQPIAQVPAEQKSYTDATVYAGTIFQYRFRSVFQGKQSGPGEVLNFQLAPPPPPPPITNYFPDGEKAYKAGNYIRARDLLSRVPRPESLIEQQKDYLSAQVMLGEIAVREKRYQAAVSHLKEAQSILINRPDVYYWLANAYLGLKQYRPAIANFEEVYVYQENLTGNSGRETIFNTDYGLVVSYYQLWQDETAPQPKRRYETECFNRADHFLFKYADKPAIGPADAFRTRCQNVRIFQQNISSYQPQTGK